MESYGLSKLANSGHVSGPCSSSISILIVIDSSGEASDHDASFAGSTVSRASTGPELCPELVSGGSGPFETDIFGLFLV